MERSLVYTDVTDSTTGAVYPVLYGEVVSVGLDKTDTSKVRVLIALYASQDYDVKPVMQAESTLDNDDIIDSSAILASQTTLLIALNEARQDVEEAERREQNYSVGEE